VSQKQSKNSTKTGPEGTATELLFERKELIPAIQELIIDKCYKPQKAH